MDLLKSRKEKQGLSLGFNLLRSQRVTKRIGPLQRIGISFPTRGWQARSVLNARRKTDFCWGPSAIEEIFYSQNPLKIRLFGKNTAFLSSPFWGCQPF